MVRALATEDVKGSQWIKVLGKEVGGDSLLGITMGMGVGIIGFGRSDWNIRLAVGLATTTMVTSTANVSSLFLYFSIATVIIGSGTGWWM
ncbi:MAG: hypothetical protein R3B95_02685 [Nitrospirales bacterium]|nr:hypothetical protein [Nitrospirales bacterium]